MSVGVDDKLLGEKNHYYCSSSSEDEAAEETTDIKQQPPGSQTKEFKGKCVNTGPKGVIEDWRKFKQLETEHQESKQTQKEELVKKLSMTCISYLNDKKKEDGLLDDIQVQDDDFLIKYREQRLEEMKRLFQNVSNFGKVMCLTPEEFTAAVDHEKPHVMIIVHVYDECSQACESMNGCLACLAQEYPTVKFCKLKASEAMMSGNFVENGVPALLIYRNKELVGNFIRLSDEFGEDFFATDVESFLLEHGFLPIPDGAVNSKKKKEALLTQDSDSGSEFGID